MNQPTTDSQTQQLWQSGGLVSDLMSTMGPKLRLTQDVADKEAM